MEGRENNTLKDENNFNLAGSESAAQKVSLKLKPLAKTKRKARKVLSFDASEDETEPIPPLKVKSSEKFIKKRKIKQGENEPSEDQHTEEHNVVARATNEKKITSAKEPTENGLSTRYGEDDEDFWAPSGPTLSSKVAMVNERLKQWNTSKPQTTNNKQASPETQTSNRSQAMEGSAVEKPAVEEPAVEEPIAETTFRRYAGLCQTLIDNFAKFNLNHVFGLEFESTSNVDISLFHLFLYAVIFKHAKYFDSSRRDRFVAILARLDKISASVQQEFKDKFVAHNEIQATPEEESTSRTYQAIEIPFIIYKRLGIPKN